MLDVISIIPYHTIEQVYHTGHSKFSLFFLTVKSLLRNLTMDTSNRGKWSGETHRCNTSSSNFSHNKTSPLKFYFVERLVSTYFFPYFLLEFVPHWSIIISKANIRSRTTSPLIVNWF